MQLATQLSRSSQRTETQASPARPSGKYKQPPGPHVASSAAWIGEKREEEEEDKGDHGPTQLKATDIRGAAPAVGSTRCTSHEGNSTSVPGSNETARSPAPNGG